MISTSYRNCVTIASDPTKRNALKVEGVERAIIAPKGISGVISQRLSRHTGQQLATPAVDLAAGLAAGVLRPGQSHGLRALRAHQAGPHRNRRGLATPAQQRSWSCRRSRKLGSCEVSVIGFINHSSASHLIGVATPAPRERRTNTQRIAQLEHGLLEMQQQLESTNKELSKLIVEIEERKVIEGQLRRELEQYHREYGSSMSYADQYMDAVGHVNEFGLTRKAGVGPEAVQIEQGVQLSPMDDCMGKGDVQNKRGAEATPMEDGVHPEAAESVQRPAETSQMEDEPSGSASMNNIVSIPRATCPDAPQAQEVSPMHVGSGEMIDTETAATEGKQRQEEGATLEIGIGESSQSTEGTQSELLCQGPPLADDQTQNTPDVATNHPSSRMAPESTSIMEVGTANEGTVGSGVAH